MNLFVFWDIGIESKREQSQVFTLSDKLKIVVQNKTKCDFLKTYRPLCDVKSIKTHPLQTGLHGSMYLTGTSLDRILRVFLIFRKPSNHLDLTRIEPRKVCGRRTSPTVILNQYCVSVPYKVPRQTDRRYRELDQSWKFFFC